MSGLTHSHLCAAFACAIWKPVCPPSGIARSEHEFVLLAALQADAGAQAVQIFDSWASNLAPQDYDIFAGPYINQIVDSVKQTHPNLPLILYISGSGGLLERMAKCNVEVISIDGSVDMRDAIKRIGPNFAVQVCTCCLSCVVAHTVVLASLFLKVAGSLHMVDDWHEQSGMVTAAL